MREEGLSSLRVMPFKMILGPLRSLDCTLRTMNGCEATHAPEARNLMVKVRGLGGLVSRAPPAGSWVGGTFLFYLELLLSHLSVG